MALINFFSEQITFTLPHPRKTSSWIKRVIESEKRTLESLNYVFCNDEFLLEINRDFLNHKSLTDIITFNNQDDEDDNAIAGEIYISVPRVKENAVKFRSDFDVELHRVMIHGVLHLIGYSDKSVRQKSIMRKKEDAYLSLRS